MRFTQGRIAYLSLVLRSQYSWAELWFPKYPLRYLFLAYDFKFAYQYNIGVSQGKRKIQMQELKQQLEKGLRLLSELPLELTDAEKLDAVIKLLPYLKSVSNEDNAPKMPINQFLPETLPELVHKLLTKQLYEKYVSWCELQGFPPENIGNFATFLHRLNVERNRTVQTNVYDVLESKTPKWPCLLD